MNEDMFEKERFNFFQHGLNYTLGNALSAMLNIQFLNQLPESFQVPGYNAYYIVTKLKGLDADVHSTIRKYYTISLLCSRTGYPVDILDLIYRNRSETRLAGIYIRLGEMEFPMAYPSAAYLPMEGSTIVNLIDMWLKSQPDIMSTIKSAVRDAGGKNESQRSGR